MRNAAVRAIFSVSFSNMSAIILHIMERRFKLMSFEMHEVILLKVFEYNRRYSILDVVHRVH